MIVNITNFLKVVEKKKIYKCSKHILHAQFGTSSPYNDYKIYNPK